MKPLHNRSTDDVATVQPSSRVDAANTRSPVLGNSALFATAGGFLDGFTYVGHGHVFANAMTGNVVLLGIDCISGSWHTGFRHLPPICAFLLGISTVQALRLQKAQRYVRDRDMAVLALEISVLCVLSLLPASTADFWITTSVAFVASMQIQTFREVNGQSYNSTFVTGNLRTLSEAAFDWCFAGHAKETARVVRDFALICAAFLIGATAGGYTTGRFENHALWFAIAPLLLVVFRIRQRHFRSVSS